jgi:chemotaxis protein CheD
MPPMATSSFLMPIRFFKPMEMQAHYLYPAALFAHKEPHIVNTILGSCVSVCLYDSKLKIGGINHFMLPHWNGQELASPKYGNIAIEKLLDKMLEMGSQHKYLIAKVFGGGEVIQVKNYNFNVGLRNIELATGMLGKMHIPIVASSLGGKEGRKIQFNTFEGSVKMKFVHQTSPIEAVKKSTVS